MSTKQPTKRKTGKKFHHTVGFDLRSLEIIQANTRAFAKAIAALEAVRDVLLATRARSLAEIDRASFISTGRASSRRGRGAR